MIECRTIELREANEFLSVMCEVFELDESRASHVFYSEPFFDIDRKWALFEDEQIVSVLTLTPLIFGWGTAVGIAGVGTLPNRRKKGLASELLRASLDACEANGFAASYLFATNPIVYQRLGFQVIDEVISGDVLPLAEPGEPLTMSFDDVRAEYTAWAEKDDRRLRRDAARWKAWEWVYRPCERFAGGYIANEPMLCREAILAERACAWPVVGATRWMGLRSMTDSIGVPLARTKSELLFMGRNSPWLPQMFMTDQF